MEINAIEEQNHPNHPDVIKTMTLKPRFYNNASITLEEGDPPLEPFTEMLIQQLKRPDNVIELSIEDIQISTEKHIKSWKKAKERTSSGDKVLHFGHCIATTSSSYQNGDRR